MENRRSFFKNLCITALVDGRFRSSERELLITFAKKLRIERAQATVILNEVKANPGQAVKLPQENDDKQTLFDSMLKVVVADKHVSPEEQQLLRRIGEVIGMRPIDVQIRIDEALPEISEATENLAAAAKRVSVTLPASELASNPTIDPRELASSKLEIGPIKRAGRALLVTMGLAIFISLFSVLGILGALSQSGLNSQVMAWAIAFAWRIVSLSFLMSAGYSFAKYDLGSSNETLERGFRHLANGLISIAVLAVAAWFALETTGANLFR